LNDETRTQTVVGQGHDPCGEASPLQNQASKSVPTLRYRKPADRRSRVQRWRDAVADLQALKTITRLGSRPENMADGATPDALRAICDLDLSELQSIVPPKGFGRN
jgi:hypothetical protein